MTTPAYTRKAVRLHSVQLEVREGWNHCLGSLGNFLPLQHCSRRLTCKHIRGLSACGWLPKISQNFRLNLPPHLPCSQHGNYTRVFSLSIFFYFLFFRVETKTNQLLKYFCISEKLKTEFYLWWLKTNRNSEHKCQFSCCSHCPNRVGHYLQILYFSSFSLSSLSVLQQILKNSGLQESLPPAITSFSPSLWMLHTLVTCGARILGTRENSSFLSSQNPSINHSI